jgi:hypothetical protein
VEWMRLENSRVFALLSGKIVYLGEG